MISGFSYMATKYIYIHTSTKTTQEWTCSSINLEAPLVLILITLEMLNNAWMRLL